MAGALLIQAAVLGGSGRGTDESDLEQTKASKSKQAGYDVHHLRNRSRKERRKRDARWSLFSLRSSITERRTLVPSREISSVRPAEGDLC